MIENSILIDLNKECEVIRKRLEEYGGHPIRVVEDESVRSGGEVDYCLTKRIFENIVRYNPNVSQDSLLYGLLMLEMAIENTIDGSKKTIVIKQHHRDYFHQLYGKEVRKLHKDKHPQIVRGMEAVMHETHIYCIVEMAMNLLVMERQYHKYPAFRSMQKERAENYIWAEIDVLQTPEYVGLIPKDCEKVDRIKNIVYAIHFRELFDVNLVDCFSPNDFELKRAKDLYDEFKACYRFFEPGKEYELIEYFATSLGIGELFSIEYERKEDIRLYPGYDDDESTFHRLYDEIMNSEHQEIPKEVVSAKNAQFALKYQDGADEKQTEMMAKLMVEAMESFVSMTIEKIANIAIETAFLCTKGILPNDHYSLTTIPSKDFSGWSILAYMYTSLKMINPSFIDNLELPFETAFCQANKIFGKKYGFE